MNSALARVFFGSSIRSIVSAGLNLLTTVLLVRWFGAETYAHYIVDLAIIGLLLILLEVVPSNYSVFRVQDDPAWQSSIAAQIAVTIVIGAALVLAVGFLGGAFHGYSPYMGLYAATMAIKRYLDIRLQSSGRLAEYMSIEVSTSAIRLALLGVFYMLGTAANFSVWASLAMATLLGQIVWWVRHPSEFRSFAGCADQRAWTALVESFPSYVPYYAGIALKRIKDNFVPLAAERLFDSRELLAAFLLAHRGVLFAVGQVRILESMLNHRAALASVQKMTVLHRSLIATSAQGLCLIVSTVTLLSSGLHDLPWLTTVALSIMVWPVVFITLERAKAFSNFQANRVNGSIFAYLCVVTAGSIALKLAGEVSGVNFSWVLVAAETIAFVAIRLTGQRHDDKEY